MALHVGDKPARVLINRQRLSAAINCPDIAWLDQVHGNRCVAISQTQTHAVPQADACWTVQPQQALAVLTADCVPVLLWSSVTPAVAAVHAGWRGLHTGVIAQAVAALASPAQAQDSQVLPGESLSAWIGPCISAAHYEVGEDVWGHFIEVAAAHVHKHPRNPAKRLLDLAGIASAQLAQLGLRHIYQSGFCSFADQRFYSYRRDGVTGRTASVIVRLG
jgi:hypothetical protein